MGIAYSILSIIFFILYLFFFFFFEYTYIQLLMILVIFMLVLLLVTVLKLWIPAGCCDGLNSLKTAGFIKTHSDILRLIMYELQVIIVIIVVVRW